MDTYFSTKQAIVLLARLQSDYLNLAFELTDKTKISVLIV